MALSEKILTKIKEAKSLDELKDLAKKNDLKMSEEKLVEIFNRYHTSGELADDDLTHVSGGCAEEIPSSGFCYDWIWKVDNHTTYEETKGDPLFASGKPNAPSCYTCAYGCYTSEQSCDPGKWYCVR